MRKVYLIFALILAFAGTYFFLGNRTGNQNASPTKTQETKNYQTGNPMNFSIRHSFNLKVDEKINQIILSHNNSSIYIDRVSTDYENIDNYFANLDSNNTIAPSSDSPVDISGYEARVRHYNTTDLGTRKEYSIYVSNQVFNLFTDQPKLYDDLDQIAQSFKYLGD